LNKFLYKDKLENLPISFYIPPEDTRDDEEIMDEFIKNNKINVWGGFFIVPAFEDDYENWVTNHPSGRIFGIQQYTFLKPPDNLTEFYKKYASADFEE
jgi:hypothetical protein